MKAHHEARRDHAARVFVTHGDACQCDLCRASVAVLRSFDPSALTCVICSQQFRCDTQVNVCPDCIRARDCLFVDTCPRCAHPRAVVHVPRDDRLRCTQCSWDGSALLMQGLGRAMPRMRVVSENLLIPF